MPIPIEDSENLQRRILELEQELDEMTAELTHAWDQLVPFLQSAPQQTESAQDITIIIQATIAAADTEVGGVFLFENEEWYPVPEDVVLQPVLQQSLKTEVKIGEVFQWQSDRSPIGEVIHWIFVPITTREQIIGAIGVGTRNEKRLFNAADWRIISRMADRVASQVVATQLARSREREAKAQQEMQIASMIQRSLQPIHYPQMQRLELASYWEPAKEVGGDAWGWIEQPDGKLAWFILDVAGKGLPAALVAVSFHAAIRVGLHMCLSPAKILNMINDEFYEVCTRTDLMATVAIITLEPTSGHVEIANAGHPPILVRQKKAWLQVTASVPPVGVMPEFSPQTEELILQPQDLIATYSDGFSEIETNEGWWGTEGLQNCAPDDVNSADTFIEHIVAVAQKINQQEDLRDDQTLVVVVYR
ncbi:MAG: serine/threonine-protein phosphatase [Anaerolineae bacterium]|nr:serine/threonine-protein phosphatase [Anaerolineae bacterium]